MKMIRKKRQGLIVWYQHRRHIKDIRRHGHLIYVSKKLKYAVLYVNQENIDEIEEKLLRQSYISKVDRSYKPFMKTEFEKKDVETKKPYIKVGL